MKKIIIYLLFIFISTNSYAQFYSVNISYPLYKTPFIWDDIKTTSLDGVKFGLSKSYLSSKYFDGKITLSLVNYGFKNSYGDSSLAEEIYRGSTINLSHQFKRNIFGNFSVFIDPYFIIPFSNSFERVVDGESIYKDYSPPGDPIFDYSYGISYLSDNLINFEISFNGNKFWNQLENRHNLYLTVGYVIK